MVDPALLVELPHSGVDEREPGLGLLEGLPLGIVRGRVPRDVDADLVHLHPVVELVVHGHRVEKLPPDQLRDDLRIKRLVRALQKKKKIGIKTKAQKLFAV